MDDPAAPPARVSTGSLPGWVILAGISALAIVPASRLPRYRPGEIPDHSPTGAAGAE